MKTVKWNGFTIKYNEEEFNSEQDVIEFVEEIYNGYQDEFANSKTINLTCPDYVRIGKKKYEYAGGRLYDYCESEWW